MEGQESSPATSTAEASSTTRVNQNTLGECEILASVELEGRNHHCLRSTGPAPMPEGLSDEPTKRKYMPLEAATHVRGRRMTDAVLKGCELSPQAPGGQTKKKREYTSKRKNPPRKRVATNKSRNQPAEGALEAMGRSTVDSTINAEPDVPNVDMEQPVVVISSPQADPIPLAISPAPGGQSGNSQPSPIELAGDSLAITNQIESVSEDQRREGESPAAPQRGQSSPEIREDLEEPQIKDDKYFQTEFRIIQNSITEYVKEFFDSTAVGAAWEQKATSEFDGFFQKYHPNWRELVKGNNAARLTLIEKYIAFTIASELITPFLPEVPMNNLFIALNEFVNDYEKSEGGRYSSRNG
ncbi:hypothetical protein ABW19_dt0205932 [Dactylella cylindrospora]|nr:hypothetical protein ABW19_dt0205932 [Dactylella cylindrospora]